MPDKEGRAVRQQYGALPYRLAEDGEVELLLVTSRGSGRWVIPKGWPIKKLKPQQSAAREAYEEAGVRGRVSGRSIGSFRYEKRPDEDASAPLCEVKVFPLLVERHHKRWPEMDQREQRWFSAAEASGAVAEAELQELILRFAARFVQPPDLLPPESAESFPSLPEGN
jgi:8-oxo-dGTP pyrophosphatase MutT (NUDIX family)